MALIPYFFSKVGTQQSSTILPLPFDVSSLGFLEPATVANLLAADTVSPPAAAILKSKKIFKSLMDSVCGERRGGKGKEVHCRY